MWEWLHGLSQGQATFLGTLAGSSIGLIALLLGALFNAHLNRRRDDRLRRKDQRAVATALKAELAGLRRALLSNSELLRSTRESFFVPDLAHSVRIIPEMIEKLSLLDPETIQSVMDAYVMVEQYYENLLMLGGLLQENLTSNTGRRLVALVAHKAPHVIALNTSLVDAIREAMTKLDAVIANS